MKLKLTESQKKHLALTIKHKVDSPTFNLTERALIAAAFLQTQIDDPVFNHQSQAEFKKHLESLEKQINKAIKQVAALTSTNADLLDQSCWYANDFDQSFIDPREGDKGVEQRLLEIQKGVSFHLIHMKKPSKVRDPYSNAIRDLSQNFAKIFPHESCDSNQSGSLFSDLVLFWLNTLIDEKEIEDPQRHIEKAFPEKYKVKVKVKGK